MLRTTTRVLGFGYCPKPRPCHRRVRLLLCRSARAGILASAVTAGLSSSPARAADYFWNSSAGGVFSLSNFWSPFDPFGSDNGPGGTADTVHFNLGVAPVNRYIVTGVSGQNSRLLVHNDSLALDVTGNYTLVNTSITTPSFTVGVAAGDAGNVVLSGSGTLQTDYSSIGHVAGSSGAVVVDGLRWTGSVDLYVGNSGSGTLTIQNGGSVSNKNVAIIGGQAGSTGTVTVTGTGSAWSHSFLVVGASGTGTMKIEAGGSISSAGASIGDSSGSTGAVTVTSSTWSASGGELAVGSRGTGTMKIEAGGSVSNASGIIGRRDGSTGTVTVTGAGSTWSNSTGLIIGGDSGDAGGAGTLTIEDQGVVAVGGTTKIWGPGVVNLNGGTLRTRNLDHTAGKFNWNAGTLHLTHTGGLTIGAAGAFGAALLLNQNQILQVEHALTVQTGATLFAAGGLVAGSVEVVAGGQAFIGGAVQQFGSGLTNRGHLVFTQAAAVDGPVTNASGGAITALGDVTFSDMVSGPGGFFGPGNITFNGGFSPGASPAEVFFESGAAFGSGNTLVMELGGLTLGTQHDHLEVSGALSLGGALEVLLINGFAPSVGDSFDLMDFGSLSGTFAQLNLPSLSSELSWNTSNLYISGVISVVPEPGVSLLPAVVVLFTLRHRRK